LLDHRRAATHWQYVGQLAARHPTVKVDPDVLWVDEGTVLTSAGLAAGIDLCVQVVRAEHGSEAAVRSPGISAPRRAWRPCAGSPPPGSARPGGCWKPLTCPSTVIAARCGLGTAANLRLHLARDADATPTAYRAAYQGRSSDAREAGS
jgi:transcriptional regulator GlxA family with amidase domain